MVSTRASSFRADSAGPESSSPSPTKPTRAKRTTSTAVARRSRASGWSHTPNRATLFWMAISLPLVAWDTVYVLGRPHTMEGGAVHWPLWVPYKLYGQVDHVYGWKAFNARNGFTAAQAFLNLVESVMYIAYLWLYFVRGKPTGTSGVEARAVSGRAGAAAVLIGFSAAVMTLSKTVLYCRCHLYRGGVRVIRTLLTIPGMNEYYSGFGNIGHNSFLDLIYLWIIPKFVPRKPV